MNSNRHDLGDLRDWFVALERQNRRFKQVGAALFIVVASLVAMGQTSSKKTVEADEFIVRDARGKIRIKLALDTKSGAPEIDLFDAEGKCRVKLEGDFLPGLSLYDSQERHRGKFAVNDMLGSSVLALYDEKGQTSAFLQDDELDFDSQGIPVVVLGKGILTVHGDGDSGAVLTPGMAGVFDDQGFSAALGVQSLETPRTGGTHKTSAASLVLFDKSKNVIWKAP